MADTSMHGQLGSAAPAEDEELSGGAAGSGTAGSGTAEAKVVRSGLLGWVLTAPGRLRRTIRGHWQFSLIVLAAFVMRAVVMIAYPPMMWFNDSFNYFNDAITHVPDYVRPNGYPFFLSLFLLPFHSVYPIAILQPLMGLAMGVAIYALLRHRGLPWWGAALPAVPVLFDVFELQLEHMVTADALFTFLVTIALILCCWNDRPSVPVIAVAGLLIGYATIVRSVGQPLLVVFIAAMLLRWVGWKRLLSLAVAGALPIVAYATWFHHTSGKYALTEAGGTFLYSRVSTFSECSKMHPPADLRVLCDSTPTYHRPPSQEYLWKNYELWPDDHRMTPLAALTGQGNAGRFTPSMEGLTQRFAELAIRAQFGDYVRMVYTDTMHTFGWDRQPDPNDQNGNGNGPEFRFADTTVPVPWWAQHAGNDVAANSLSTDLHKYLGGSIGQPRVNHPWAGFVQGYQRVIWLRGPFLLAILLIGLVGAVGRWRGRGGTLLLPWLAGMLLIVLPPMTAGFSYRYVIAAVPAVCLAAGLAFARQPGERSVRALAADLGRYFGRGVPVKQE